MHKKSFGSILLLGLLSAASSPAATYTYTGNGGSAASPVTGVWNSASSWQGAAIPASGTATALSFGGTAAGVYTSTNNLGTFVMNQMTLNSASSGTATIAGGVLQFQSNGATLPTLVQNGSGAFTLSGSIVLSNSLTLNGSGSGTLTLGGVISGAGNGLVFSNGSGMTVLGGANTFTGGVTLNSGTVRSNAALGLGSTAATLALNGGTLDLVANNVYNASLGGDATVLANLSSAGAGPTRTLGTLSAGTNTLSIGGGSNVTSGTATVVFGNTTLAGNTTFRVMNPGSAATFLTLGALDDGGVGRTITKTGDGTLNLATAATNLGSSSTVVIKEGTLRNSGSSVLGTANVLLGDTGGAASAAFQGGASATFSNTITVQAGSTGLAMIGSATNNIAPTYAAVVLNKDVVFTPYNGSMTVNSISGVGGITLNSVSLGASSSGQAYGITGGSVTLNAANTFQGDTKIFSGALNLGNGTDVTSWLGTSTNAVQVGDSSGVMSARLVLSNSGESFTRNVNIQAGNGGISGFGTTTAGGGTMSGNLALGKSVYLIGGNSSTAMNFTGTIARSADAVGAVSVTATGDRSAQVSLSTANSYDGGTVVGIGLLDAKVAGSLGTGNALAEGGILRMSSTTALASGRGVHVGDLGGLSIGTATITQSYLQSILDASSSGAIAIGVGTYSATLNMAALGNGLMYLGSDVSSTYSATSLGANSDGNYRLGYNAWGSTSLTISNGVLVDSGTASQLIVGNPMGFTNGVGSTGQGIHTDGQVILTGSNTYSGGTVINNNSVLQGRQATVAGSSPFGSSTAAMTLHNSTLQLNPNGTSTVGTQVGAVGYDGNAAIKVGGTTGGNNTLTVGQLTRNGGGVLQISASSGTLGSTAFLKTNGTLATITVATSSTTTAQMVAPYIQDLTNGNFLTYDATNGFTDLNSSYTTITGAPTNAYVRTGTGGAAQSITTSATIAALSTGTGQISNTSASDVTLTITSGALQAATGLGNVNLGGTTAGTRINLDFGGQEAVIGVQGTGLLNGSLTVAGAIGNTGGNGLTKTGIGSLSLTSTTSTFTGPITINQGTVNITNDLNLGGSGASLNNGLVLNGGAILTTVNTTLNAGRTITLGEAGGGIGTSNGNFTSVAMTVAGVITGTGSHLDIFSNISNAATAASVTTLSNTGNDFVAPIYVGVNQFGRITLAFDDNHELGNSGNSVTLIGGNSILAYTGMTSTSMNRALIFQDQGGGVDVTNAVTLTNSGAISGSGLFNKNGIGTLALTGSSSFNGNTDITAGVLNVSNADALGQTTAAISGSSGVSGGAVYVQSGAALEVQGGIALSGTGGKALYLNGSGINGNGALRSVSGTNSNAGPTVLQSDSTIGVDAGSLTLSGTLSGTGALTKVGSGTLTLSGINTSTGSATVSVGTLVINGRNTSSVTVAGGAILGGSGTTGAITVQSGGALAPGNSPGILTAPSAVFSGSAIYAVQVANSGSTGAVSIGGRHYDQTVLTGNSASAETVLTLDPAQSVLDLEVTGSQVSFDNYFIFNLTDSLDTTSGVFAWATDGVQTVSITNAGGGLYSFTLGGVDYALGYTGDASTNSFIGGNDVVIHAVPEPSTMILLGIGTAGVLYLRRRRS